MTSLARGSFDVTILPAPAELDGRIARYSLEKVFHGDLEATGNGLMLSGGDPSTGFAGYVAVEVVIGTLGEKVGSFAMMQLGMMASGTQELHYRIVPGSGNGELTGLTGELHLVIDADGTHRYELSYDVEPA